MLKKIFLLMTCLMCYTVFAQQNLSVPLTDPVYNVLEYAELRNYCKKLHNSRPYTLDLIVDTLQTILSHPEISLEEKIIVQDTIDRLQPIPPTQFVEGATFWQNVGTLGKTGSYRYESADTTVPVSAQVGVTWQTNIDANFNDPSGSTYNWLDLFVLGDIGNNFSYNVNIGLGIMKLDQSSHRPNSFSKSWDGYQYLLSNLSSGFEGSSEELAGAMRLLPEFGVSFWDNKLGINFSRIRRDWGTGNGNLLLSETARPFVAIEMYLRPVDFISLSSITGILEFYTFTGSEGIKDDAAIFQNAYSAFMGEIFFGEYAYAALTSSVIWPKRFELGYMLPGMIPFFYQNMIGDFDNMLMGLSLGANIPGYANFYFNLLVDEWSLKSDNFFHKARNMYAFQAGVKVAIPNTSFVTFNLQYTKLEPFMYTHPGTIVPWYSEPDGLDKDGNPIVKPMQTYYVNHGENLGYGLPPNSDEIKITATSMPFWFLQTDMFYSLVRHGIDTTQTIDGETWAKGNYITDSLPYGKIPTISVFEKYFLTDGVYEWIHSLGINARLDMRFINDIPLTLNLGYTLTYTHHTTPDVLHKSFKAIDNAQYKNRFGNYLTLSIKVY